jgi:beta-lactamase regulating signal transducer with metallopeptidase domain
MSHLTFWLSRALVDDIGWTLIQFLWQGLAIAALLYLVLPLCRSATARYNCALGALIAMGLAPIATFAVIHAHGESGGGLITASGSFSQGFVAGSGMAAATTGFRADWTAWLVVLWLAGVATLSLRAIASWFLVRSWRHRDTAPLPDALLQRCRDLQQRLSLTRPVQFLQSCRISVPMVIGRFKPVVLVPVSAVTGLPPQQLDALILHELAHIVRLDAFANVMQIAVETALFYHPAVWWVSRRVRAEREHCCDDAAVSACGNVTTYVEALITLESGRKLPALGLAASGGKLTDRVARLLGRPTQARRSSFSALVGLAILGLVLASTATAETAVPAGHQAISIRIVDDVAAGSQRPIGDDRVPLAKPHLGEPDALWLKRDGQISGDIVAEAHVASGPNGRPLIWLTFTPKAAAQFSELTRDNVGHRFAIVVNNRIVTAPVLMEPIVTDRVQIDAQFASEDAARAVVAEMMGTGQASTP